MSRDYFQSDDFRAILKTYEHRHTNGRSVYLDADDFADIADYYLTNQASDLAIEAVREGFKLHPDDEVLLIMESAIYIYDREYERSERVLERLDANSADVVYQLAQLQYAKYGNVEKAEQIWRNWMQMDHGGDDDGAELRECYIHIISSIVELRGDGEEAVERSLQVARKWIGEYIKNFQPLGAYDEDVQLADICRENDLPDLMCTVLTQVLEEQPYLDRGWTNLALGWFVQKRYEQTLEACDFALAIDADDLDALLTKAHTLHAMGETVASKPVFKEYLDKGGEIVQAIPYTEALFKDGETAEAKKEMLWLKEMVEMQLQDMEDNLKTFLKKSRKTKEEIRQQKESHKAFEQFYERVYLDIADLYHRHHFFQESIDANMKVLKVNPNSAEAYFMLGINYLSLDKYEDASRNFSLALQWANDQVMMGMDIALTFILNNFDHFALEVLDAVEKASQHSDSPYRLNIPAAKSLAYLKMGNKGLFIESFKQACVNTPELVQKVYDGFFPKDVPVRQWGDYAEKDFDTLLKNFKRDNVYFKDFS